MTRTKEVDPGSNDVPEYKSTASRLVHSLRKGYNNLRKKIQDARNDIKYYQIKVRDLEKSRSQWKEEAKSIKNEAELLKKEIQTLQDAKARLEKEVKKKPI